MQTSCGVDARCLQQPVVDIFTEVQAEVMPQLPFSSDEVVEPTDDFSVWIIVQSEDFCSRMHYIEIVSLHLVSRKRKSSPSSWKVFLLTSAKWLMNSHNYSQLPDYDPLSRSVKHYISVPNDVVPAARKAYPLPQHTLTAMREQIRELIDKGWVKASASS